MPTISMFYGILVLMFFRDNRRHHLPHIHVRYQGEEATISIEDGSILDGALPPKQFKMVQAWIEIHKEELFVAMGMGSGFQVDKLTNSAILSTRHVSMAS